MRQTDFYINFQFEPEHSGRRHPYRAAESLLAHAIVSYLTNVQPRYSPSLLLPSSSLVRASTVAKLKNIVGVRLIAPVT